MPEALAVVCVLCVLYASNDAHMCVGQSDGRRKVRGNGPVCLTLSDPLFGRAEDRMRYTALESGLHPSLV